MKIEKNKPEYFNRDFELLNKEDLETKRITNAVIISTGDMKDNHLHKQIASFAKIDVNAGIGIYDVGVQPGTSGSPVFTVDPKDGKN